MAHVLNLTNVTNISALSQNSIKIADTRTLLYFILQAMEIGNASVLAFEYSSVRIKFAALSEETVSKFIESLNEPVDLQRLINQIFTQDQLLLLEKRNIHKIRIELNVPERSLITSKKYSTKSSRWRKREQVNRYFDVYAVLF